MRNTITRKIAACTLTALMLAGCSSQQATMEENTHGSILLQEDEPVVQVTGGYIRGVLDEDVYSFKGIPYAEAERLIAVLSSERMDNL